MNWLQATPNRPASKRRGSNLCNAGILRSESGQSLAELALMTPLLVLMLIGVIELGRYAQIAILVGNAARAGAAYGAQSLAQSADKTGIQTSADNDFQNSGQNVSLLTVNSSFTCGCDSGGTVTQEVCNGAGSGLGLGTCASGSHWVVTVAVQTTGTFNSMFKFPGIPASIKVDRTCSMRVNQH
jgi:Flp pilus assembly protein TadG